MLESISKKLFSCLLCVLITSFISLAEAKERAKENKILIPSGFAYETLKSYASYDQRSLFYNYAFDMLYSSVNVTTSSYGLSRYSKHKDEVNAIYGANLIVNSLLLYRIIGLMTGNGIFYEKYMEAKNINNPAIREKVSDYRLNELSNEVRQLRKISGTFSLVSAGFIAALSKGKTPELATAAILAGNAAFYLFFYESYGEDAYEKYYFLKKAYPVSFGLMDSNLILCYEYRF